MRSPSLPLRLVLFLASIALPLRLGALELATVVRLTPCQELQIAREALQRSRTEFKREHPGILGTQGQCITVDNSGHNETDSVPKAAAFKVKGNASFSPDGSGHVQARWDGAPLLFAFLPSPSALPGYWGYRVDADPLVEQPIAELTLIPDPGHPGEGTLSGIVHLAARLVLESDDGGLPIEVPFPLALSVDGRYVLEMSAAIPGHPAEPTAYVIASGPCELAPGPDCLILIELAPPSGGGAPSVTRCYCEDCSDSSTCTNPPKP